MDLDKINTDPRQYLQKAFLALIDNELKKRIDERGVKKRDSKGILRMIISGTAGSGKSYGICAMKKVAVNRLGLVEARRRVAFVASTGTATANIKGSGTAHSFLKLPVNSKFAPLENGQALTDLEKNVQDLWLLVLDERSMVGARTFWHIHERLCQGTGRPDLAFGGVAVIIVGDDGQLQPIGDRPLWQNEENKKFDNIEQKNGHLLLNWMHTAIHLTNPFRQKEEDPFYKLLLESREGRACEYEKDNSLLYKRSWGQVDRKERDEFLKDSLFLNPLKEAAWEHNVRKLDELGNPIMKLISVNSNKTAASATGDDVGLKKILYLAKGAQVMVNMNIWTKAGVVNGAMGTVVGFYNGTWDDTEDHHTAQNAQSTAAVLVHFPHYTGPRFEGFPDDPKWDKVLPITRRTVNFTKSGAKCMRTQFPLALGWAVTIHKSQGMTIGPGQNWRRMILDLGNTELSSGLTFVALSRAMELGCILFMPGKCPSLARLAKCKTDTMEERKQFDEVISNLSASTLRKYKDLIDLGVPRPTGP